MISAGNPQGVRYFVMCTDQDIPDEVYHTMTRLGWEDVHECRHVTPEGTIAKTVQWVNPDIKFAETCPTCQQVVAYPNGVKIIYRLSPKIATLLHEFDYEALRKKIVRDSVARNKS
jgi:hypothetical protein